MSSILYEREFTKLESSIHESTYKLFMHLAWMDMCIDNAMRELELRTRAMMEARDEMQVVSGSLSLSDESEKDNAVPTLEAKSLPSVDFGATTRTVLKRTLLSLESGTVTKLAAALTWAALMAPVTALDDQMILGRAFSMPSVVDLHHISTIAVGTVAGMLLLCGGSLMGVARSLLGPLMGITSVLYFMMRNDAAVEPMLAWGVLSSWSVFALMYLAFQSRRVTYNKIYMLATLAFSGLCLCIVALVQKSSIQGGLVTAIPPCTSFAAYAVAFLFPDRPVQAQHLDIV